MEEFEKSIETIKKDKILARVEYAVMQFEDNNIEYHIKNLSSGHIHAYSKTTGKLFQFWAGTGKILGSELRGIHNLIEMLK